MKIFNVRRLFLFLIDVMLVILSYGLVYGALRIAINLDIADTLYELISLGATVLCISLSRVMFRVYGNIWRYAGTREYIHLVLSDTVGFALNSLVSIFVFSDFMHFLFIFTVSLVSLIAVLTSRFIYRQYRIFMVDKEKKSGEYKRRYAAIIGAGHTGLALLSELKNDKNHKITPYCFIDVDKSKAGAYLSGVKVLYSKDDDIEKLIKGTPVTDIIIAIPSASVEKKNRIITNCAKTGCKVKIYENIFERGGGKSNRLNVRDVKVEDLLSRGVITFDSENVKKLIENKVVLVTGGGGSIGSELCRQIAAMQPKKLIILDIYENSTYLIEQELIKKFGKKLNLAVEIASIRDKEKLTKIFNTHKPQYVFHAAAHKHVPLMEHSVDEAVKNNIFGTHNVVQVCEETGVEKMLLISTDKAVNPSSVMGATKRFCEMIIQSKKESKTEYVAVRFGNVLGSNGSVIPIFQKQIESGGPVTITDKRITRYFMTIPEAVSLVLQAFAMAMKSEIFVLDMGNPVKILDLAENMIRLSGLTPYEDIEITEVGLRPGEKLYEELLIQTEELDKTFIEKIFIERDKGFSQETINGYLKKLTEALKTEDNGVIKECLHEIIPTFVQPVYKKDLDDTDDKAIIN